MSGLDGCGADSNTAFIPLPTHSIRPPFLSEKQQQTWIKSRIATDPKVEQAVAAVSEASLVASITDLQAYHTRNSYSENIYEAEAYLAQRLTGLGFAVETMKFRPDMVSFPLLHTLPLTSCVVTYYFIFISHQT